MNDQEFVKDTMSKINIIMQAYNDKYGDDDINTNTLRFFGHAMVSKII